MNGQRRSATPDPGFGERGFAVVNDLGRLPLLLPRLYLNLTGTTL